jgi:hypothetical protein
LTKKTRPDLRTGARFWAIVSPLPKLDGCTERGRVMSERIRTTLGLCCGGLAVLVGGSGLIEMGAGLATLFNQPVEGLSAFAIGIASLPIASIAGWGAWRLFQ